MDPYLPAGGKKETEPLSPPEHQPVCAPGTIEATETDKIFYMAVES